MRYLVVADTFFPDRPSGSARVAWDIAQIMRDRGHNVTVFCRKQKQNAETISEYEGIQLVRFPAVKTMTLDPFKVYKKKVAGVAAASKYLVNTNWDMVHIHFYSCGDMVYKALGNRHRYVYTVHSPIVSEEEINWATQGLAGKIKLLFGKRILRKIEGNLFRTAAAIHTLSTFTKETIDNQYGVGDKVTVIPHWCRDGFFRAYSKNQSRTKLNWPQDARILFSVRRLESRMGLDIAIKALEPLLKNYPNLFYVIAGAGSLEKPLKQLAQFLGLSDKIWFFGRVSDEILKRCYEAADMFILPTLALECFGLPVLEALVYGLPIISTDAAAIPELMKPILPENIVPSGNINMLREKIKAYLDNQLELPSSEELINYVKQNFGSEIIIPKIISFLED